MKTHCWNNHQDDCKLQFLCLLLSSNQNIHIKLPNSSIFDTKYNQNLLSLIFKQFTDVVLLQWEEAADMLIDELLEDEIEYLNTFEGCNTEVRPRDVGEIIEELEKIEEFKMGMRGKYLKK